MSELQRGLVTFSIDRVAERCPLYPGHDGRSRSGATLRLFLWLTSFRSLLHPLQSDARRDECHLTCTPKMHDRNAKRKSGPY